jgi:1,4-dihydroxy-2-naphthoate octaprenyltransferase
MLTPQQVLWGGLAFFTLGAILGLYLVVARGEFILWLGLFSVLAGWFYTAGPVAFAYTGLGELVVFIFMGPIMVLGSYYVQAQAISLAVIWISVPIGFMVAAILHANNMRDLEEDLVNNKRTLANILGRNASRWEYYVLIGGSYVALLVLVIAQVVQWYSLLPLLTLPGAIYLIRIAATYEAPVQLNRVLRGTAQLHGRFGWLLIAGAIAAIMADVA